jgi:hypothetical protein
MFMKLFAASLADMHTHSLLDELRVLELDGQASNSELENDRYANESRTEVSLPRSAHHPSTP